MGVVGCCFGSWPRCWRAPLLSATLLERTPPSDPSPLPAPAPAPTSASSARRLGDIDASSSLTVESVSDVPTDTRCDRSSLPSFPDTDDATPLPASAEVLVGDVLHAAATCARALCASATSLSIRAIVCAEEWTLASSLSVPPSPPPSFSPLVEARAPLRRCTASSLPLSLSWRPSRSLPSARRGVLVLPAAAVVPRVSWRRRALLAALPIPELLVLASLDSSNGFRLSGLPASTPRRLRRARLGLQLPPLRTPPRRPAFPAPRPFPQRSAR